MKIRALTPTAFGKFQTSRPIELSDGLNIIRGDNEAGKSTLGAFILGMFYGFKKEGRTRIIRDNEYERYRPWTGNDYRGAIVYEEGGRTYRVERSFDPDLVRVYDDVTGEDVTHLFSQDSRKEYDFARRHLGLTAKEFRNTVWIAQLGSPQEPGLGAEIQGKLEDILQGGTQDVSLVRALSVLADERAKIKAPRSQKAKLDIVQQEIAGLKQELKSAEERAEELRGWLIEASDLSKEKERLEEVVSRCEAELARLRYGMLRTLLVEAQEIQDRVREAKARLVEVEWAKDVPPGADQQYQALSQEKDAIFSRAEEAKGELARLEQRANEIEERLAAPDSPSQVGLDEAALASLHSKYSGAKATASKSERAANDARKVLRAAEEEGRVKGYPDEEFDKDILKEAEDLQETVFLTEKAKSQMDVEVERARSQVAMRRPGSAAGLLYALALVALGLAVALTVMAMPMSWAAFAVALVLLAAGVYRQSSVAKQRREDEALLAQKEREVAEQVERVESAKRALEGYLAALGARSVEELRAVARELDSYRVRLANAKDRYEAAHKHWFEASQEFSAVEKELVGALKSLGCLEGGEAVTDVAVNLGRRKLAKVASDRRDLQALKERIGETNGLLSELEERLSRVKVRERDLLAACVAVSLSELEKKLAAKKEYDEVARTLSEEMKRYDALLSGRDRAEIAEEVDQLAAHPAVVSQEAFAGEAVEASGRGTVSESEYEAKRRAQDGLKSRLGEVKARLAALESGIRLRTEDARPVFEIEEDLARKQAAEEDLMVEREALDLAHSTLSELSKSLRREFAPELNRRVGEIMESITSGRYSDIRISPDLEISVVDPETGRQAKAADLSGGTVDQCYFALRVAIAEAITKKDEIPFFLDDSFVQYDDNRLAGALKILAALAERHQILVFSCHGREEAIAKDLGIAYRRIRL
jgi:uncharacterized protein YhaN